MINTEVLRLVYIIVSAVITALTAFGIAVDPALQAKAGEIIGAAVTIITSVVGLLEYARTKVWSKESAELLARGTMQTLPTPEQKELAAETLGLPTPRVVVPPHIKHAAEAFAGMTPGQIDDYAVKFGVEALEAAVALARRAPSQAQTDAVAVKGL